MTPKCETLSQCTYSIPRVLGVFVPEDRRCYPRQPGGSDREADAVAGNERLR